MDPIDLFPPIHLYALLAATATLLVTAPGKDGDPSLGTAAFIARCTPFLLAWLHMATYIGVQLWTLGAVPLLTSTSIPEEPNWR